VPDWDGRRPLVGCLPLDDELRGMLGEADVDAGLDAWLSAGEPPMFVGFGSMPVQDPTATVAMITRVSRELGVRALVSAGWGELSSLGPADAEVRVVGNLDHDSVLGRCRAAVHHAGAGTTAAGLQAGPPTVVCSVFADNLGGARWPEPAMRSRHP
jgi:sterol 3beta-glucosyltransferase